MRAGGNGITREPSRDGVLAADSYANGGRGDPTGWKRKGESLEEGSGIVKTGDGVTAQGEGWPSLGALNCPRS